MAKTSIYFYSVCYFLLISIAHFACVEEIEFDATGETGTLVVDGLLSTSSDSNFIHLIRTNELNKQIFPGETGALITLFDDVGGSEVYQDLGGGKYYLAGNQMIIETGRTYHIEITTNNGQQYISDPETILPAPEIDSLTFNFSIEDIVERENRVLERSFFNLFVEGEIPTDNSATFLKWDVEHIYQVAEIDCSPLIPPKVCYVERRVNKNQVLILNGEEYTDGAGYHVPVIHQELDYAFGLVASFYVSQKALTKPAFEYWDKVKNTLANGSTIFDSPPASIEGNLHSISDPQQEVLGYFSAIDEKKKVILVTRGDLVDPFDELPLCGLNGNFPGDIDFRICCNCLNLEYSSRKRPSYWP
ncbi:MAG: DUF4249 domain-containing protein [Saprospiraceae bacterium]|nr:DUF4249 domain-containing protein [Saprospiraceae bacterium]